MSIDDTEVKIEACFSDQSCISAVFTPFMEYMPYILLLQTLVLIIVEKFTFKIPRIAQKVERFYQNIVEESLFGKDPVNLVSA